MARILVVDNYDSFVYNLVQYLYQLGAECEVRRNDVVAVTDADGFDGVLLSPGPGTPEQAGISVEMVRHCAASRRPLFGVCLGQQAIGVAFGATVNRAPELMHGKTSEVVHDGLGVFEGLANPLTATRYHSLAIDPATVPPELLVTARTGEVVMGVRHRTLPIEAVQFHPESVLTDGGHRMLANWLTVCGDVNARQAAVGLAPTLAGRAA
jgi:para-aminobenzoate synthetase component II